MAENRTVWNQHYTRNKSRLAVADENVVRYLQHRLRDGFLAEDSLVLDLGCGAGRNLHYIQSLGLKVLGQDFAAEGIQELEPVVLANAEQLPYVAKSFQLVLAWGVLHYLKPKERKEAIKEIFRILKPKGRAFLSLRSDVDSHLTEAFHSGDLRSGRADFFGKEQALALFSEFSSCQYGFIMRSLLGQDKVIAHHMVEVER